MHTVILFGHKDKFNYRSDELHELLRDVLPQFQDTFHFHTDFSDLELDAPEWQPKCMNSKRTSSLDAENLRILLVFSLNFVHQPVLFVLTAASLSLSARQRPSFLSCKRPPVFQSWGTRPSWPWTSCDRNARILIILVSFLCLFPTNVSLPPSLTPLCSLRSRVLPGRGSGRI